MNRVVVLLLSLFVVLYVAIFAKLAFDFHAGMRSNRSDLGQIDQSVWNSSQGRFLENTDAGFVATRLTDHVEPILVLIAPIFWLWNDVRALLLLQVLAVGVGAFFVYWLTQIYLAPANIPIVSRLLSLVFAVVWLLIPQLQHALLTEFHAAPLAVPLILWALWAAERRYLWHFLLATLLVATVKEEMAIVAASLCVWSIYRIWRSKQGLERVSFSGSMLRIPHAVVLAGLCLLWFVVATFVIVPANAPQVYGAAESIYFQRFPDLGGSPEEIAKTLLTDPGRVWAVVREPARLDYLWGLLASLGFLSLLAPELLIFSLPLLLANLLSRYPGQYYNEFHYSAPLMPYVVVSASIGVKRVLALGNWFSTRRRFVATRLTTSLLGTLLMVWLLGWAGWQYYQHGRGPLGGRYDPIPVTAHHRLLSRFVAQVPPDAALTATAAVHPHLSHRRYIYQFPLGVDAPVPAQWALLDVTQKTDMAPGDLKNRVETLLAGDWRVVDAADGFLLLQKGVADKPTTQAIPNAFFDFARGVPSSDRSESTTANSVRWVDSTVEDWRRWRETKLVSEWSVASEAAPADTALWLNALTPGEALAYDSTALPTPAALWYPPSQWQPGETIRWTTLSLYLPRTWGMVVPGATLQPERENVLVAQDGGSALVDVYWRGQGDRLVQLAPALAGANDFAEQLANQTGMVLRQSSGCFQVEQAEPLCLRAWLGNRPTWPGENVDVWLQWQGNRWPTEFTVFVHLRRAGENQAQADGPPRYFVRYDADALLQRGGVANDWRWLAIPKTATIGEEWQVWVGLYHQQTGARVDLVDGAGSVLGNEMLIGAVKIQSPPTPDQTCALIEQSCAAQFVSF